MLANKFTVFRLRTTELGWSHIFKQGSIPIKLPNRQVATSTKPRKYRTRMELVQLLKTKKPNVKEITNLLNEMAKYKQPLTLYEVQNMKEKHRVKIPSCIYTRLSNRAYREKNPSLAKEYIREMVSGKAEASARLLAKRFSNFTGSNFDDAKNTYEMMKNQNLVITIVEYTKIIRFCCERKQLDYAREIVRDMKEAGVHPSVEIYNTLIHYHLAAKGENCDYADEFLKQMKDEELGPTIDTHRILYYHYCRTQNFTKALESLETLRAEGFSPTVYNYNGLILAYVRENQFPEALHILDVIKSYGMKPDISSFKIIFDGYLKASEPIEAHKLFEVMKLYGTRPTPPMYSNLIHSYFSANDFTNVVKVTDEMKTYGMLPDVELAKTVVLAYCHLGQVMGAMNLIKQMKQRSVKPKLPENLPVTEQEKEKLHQLVSNKPT